MIFALLALLVTGALVAAALSAANGDITLTHRTTSQEKAYFAAVAGIDRYQYQITSSPEYWKQCPSIGTAIEPKTVTGTTDEKYYVKTLGANGNASCESGKQATILEAGGTAKGTFRILSTGTVKEGSNTVTRKVVATFSHPGFTKYVYESNYEVEDPVNYGEEASVCEHYYAYRKAHNLTNTCPPIEFAPEDKVNGPMHTNDAAEICASGGNEPTFGREGHSDEIEMNGGYYAAPGCADTPNMLGKFTEAAGSVLPPPTDVELLEAAGVKYQGRTEIELKAGTPNKMVISKPGKAPETVSFPSNGVIYVENSKTEACAVTNYTPFGTDTVNDTGCGNVYVHGTYTESLTIASADDVIVNGNLTTTGGESGGEPTGSASLGLIAENFVRVYHPVKESYEATNRKPNTAAATSGKCTATSTVPINGRVTSGSTEVTGLSSTEELTAGDAVSGTGIPTGDTIKSIKNSTTIVLNTAATSGSGSSVTLTFTLPYVYYSSINKCVEETKAGYVFVESELLEYVKCESGTEYSSKGICEYVFTTGNCPSKATNLSASEDPNKWGVLENPVIDAAILSTNHSWIVDNYKCGAKLGTLTVWGSIAQFWRGPVGTSGGSGYIKNYNYDSRLAAEEPPDFLAPTTASAWKVTRETAPPTNFTG